MKLKLKNSVVFLSIIALAGVAEAQTTTTFTNTGGDFNWNTAGNWSGVVPGTDTNDVAHLDSLTGNYAVNYSSATIEPNAWSLITANTGTSLTTLNISASGFATGATVNNEISSGVINVNSGGAWTNSGNVVIDTGSSVNVEGGTLTMSGSGAVYVGFIPVLSGPATLQIDSGTLNAANGQNFNVAPYSNGLVNVNGGTLAASLFLLNTGNGALDGHLVVNGGAVTTDNFYLNDGAGNSASARNTAEVELKSGSITNAGELRLATQANFETGTVTQTGGTLTQNGNVRLASIFASNTTSAIYDLQGGTFLMTNSGHTLTMDVGSSGSTSTGLFSKEGGTLTIDNLNVNSFGTLTSAAGQTWSLYGNLTNGSTQASTFNMNGATLNFLGSRSHSFSIAGLDLGGVLAGYTNNYSIDALELATSTDSITLSGSGSGTHALYLDALLLPGNNTSLLSQINSGGLNIYYEIGDARNAYLDGQTYGLTGGGFLLPVPEPGAFALALFGFGALWLAAKKRKA